ncbi:MAG: hypothetical protein VX642_07500 [Bdellovibrionota bacterium]|nr:hypothetical protein [Bdellovibrionota bacterium]
MRRICSFVCLCLLLSACSTVPYNPRREVKIKKKWYGTNYYQGENAVNPADISKKLAQKPEFREKMKDFDSNYRIHQATGLLGGFVLFGTLFSGNSNSTNLLLSLGLLGGSYYFEREANKILSPLVRERNRFVYNYDHLQNFAVKKHKDLKVMVPVYSYKF